MYSFQSVNKLIHVYSLVTIYNHKRPSGFYFPGESHDFWEMVYVQHGDLTATADERVYQLSPGMLLLHKPWEFHRIWANQNSAPWIINISFCAHGDLIPKIENRCFDLSPEQQSLFFQIVSNFSKAMPLKCSSNIEAYRKFINITANLLEVLLINLAENDQCSAPSNAPSDERYTKIVQVMQSNYHRNLSLEQLANLCDMSTSNMKRIFHLYSGVGIAKYFLTLKIRYAMELLDKNIPINKIAELLDFSDVSYFYTVFKRETNMTPAQYKKQKTKL